MEQDPSVGCQTMTRMNLPDFENFSRDAQARGFEEVLERVWAPDTVLDEHTHPFSVEAIVVQGQMWLTVAGLTRSLERGDRFQLDRDVPHSERYGAEGATYWVARRN